MSDKTRSIRQRHNQLVRHHGADAAVVTEARRDLRAANLADHIRRVVNEAPPLTDEQRARLAALLRPIPSAKSVAS